ncbi:MAG: MiaB/RimO family radical SAM methylthiotransferase [candidate division WOR-3 bacterium]|nr:MiaB/RimO family radical SAM methylthiotransferase [candidate division WOR-3 bacterium]MDW8150562.1 MiaB/RimO family radical SAM methylthiotransferase [candidate division WOR-3 bacterium]
MELKKAFYITFGCRTNFYDTELIKSNLEKVNVVETQNIKDADYIIINSCAVTQKAERDARHAINKVLREKKENTKVILTGCIPKIKKLNLADFEASVDEVLKLFNIENPENSIIYDYKSRTRATVKVQEGCDFVCSYCAIRIARGKSRSKNIDLIMKEMDILKNRGFKEVMITGIQVGDWGKEWKLSLYYLLRKLVENYNDMRFRLSSILPLHVSDELIDLYLAFPKNLMPHFHISLQSASNKVLKDMRRPYTIEIYKRIIEKVLKIENVNIGTDIIVGFPTETDKDFLETYKFCEDVPFGYLHVFEYSPREGTPAYDLKSVVPNRVVKERVRALVELSKRKKAEYMRKFLNKKLSVLFEEYKNGYWIGTSDNYLKVKTNHNLSLKNEIFDVKIVKTEENELVGSIDKN